MYEPSSHVDFAVTGEQQKSAANVYAELAATGSNSKPKYSSDLSPLLRGQMTVTTTTITTFNECDCNNPEQRALVCCYLSFCPCVGAANFYINRGSSDATLRRLAHISCDVAMAVFLFILIFFAILLFVYIISSKS